jgi:hypothetical protein
MSSMTEDANTQPIQESDEAAPTTPLPPVPPVDATGAEPVPSASVAAPTAEVPATASATRKPVSRTALIVGGVALAFILMIAVFASGAAVGSRMGGRLNAPGRGAPPMMSQGARPDDLQRGTEDFEERGERRGGRGGGEKGERGAQGFDGQRSGPETETPHPW